MRIIIFLICIALIFNLTKDDILDFEKFYKPLEFSSMDMFSESSKWSFHRYKQSEHFFVFWEQGFGSDPNSGSVPQHLRADLGDLLNKLEQFYTTNIEKAKFAIIGQGKSYLDKYKMIVFLLYQDSWTITGSGYDDVIGALWLSPTTCQLGRSVIAHELAHSFQYQVYCDQIYQKLTDSLSFSSGFRYGQIGSNGGNSFWQQSAQWQAFQDFPDEMFYGSTFGDWIINNHRHFEHETMRYASFWLIIYWVQNYGEPLVGNLWRNSKYPEDAIDAYMRLYKNDDYRILREELFDYAMKMATYDLEQLRLYSLEFVDQYYTIFYQNGEYLQIAYKKCPGATGFNVIQLNVPDLDGDRKVIIDFVGLQPGTELAPEDPGEWMRENGFGGTVRYYNNVNKGNVGWRYGFVTINSDDSRTYSEVFSKPRDSVQFEVPRNTRKLFFVVQGSPEKYIKTIWDDNETTDAQFPYKIKLTNTSVKEKAKK